MTIKYHPELIQGDDAWLAARCGLLTASEMKLIMTPSHKPADNDKTRRHVWELLAQRITRYVEPTYISDDMLRGKEDEIAARALYHDHYAPVTDMGFITNDRWGFTIGCSPDGLVADDGMLECKSRRQGYQVQTIVECVAEETIPDDYVLQVQTALLVSERKWCDFISYSGGLHMATIRVYPDPVLQEAIVAAATAFEAKVAHRLAIYNETIHSGARLIQTERRIIQEMFA